MQEYTIKRISRTDKVAKNGKPYVSMGIQVAEFGETWINGFGSKANADWREGDKVKIIISDREHEGKTYKNFDMPKVDDEVSQLKTAIGLLRARADVLWEDYQKRTKHLTSEGTPVPFSDDDSLDALAQEMKL